MELEIVIIMRIRVETGQVVDWRRIGASSFLAFAFIFISSQALGFCIIGKLKVDKDHKKRRLKYVVQAISL